MQRNRIARAVDGVGLVLLAAAPAAHAQGPADPADRVSFAADVRPIFASKCFACHGPDAAEAKGGLQLHREAAALEHAIVPGHPERSPLVERIRAQDPDERMPPPDSGLELDERERERIERWIAQGAEWEEHWSLVPPRRSPAPVVENGGWVRNDYDRFVLRRMEENGLVPAPEAPSWAWLRRVTLDLTGLPPTVEEREAFLNDVSPGAYERVVDRLLDSDASAETLTLNWLDSARFADSNGYQYDGPNNQWPWRDWVIRAFRANMPFDEFVSLQLSGDLLPDATLDQKIATAFNRNHGFTIEGGVTPEEYRVQYVNDRVATFGTLFLGLTLDCARCHDHKFDDLSMRDFYSLSSFFDNIPGSGFWGGGLNTIATPVVRYSTTDPDELARRKAARDELEARADALETEELPEYDAWKRDVFDAERAAVVRAVRPSVEGVTAEEQGDGSWRLGGEVNPDQLVVEVELETQATDLGGVVVQALKDRGKVGRSRKGEAILSRVEVRVGPLSDPRRSKAVALVAAIGANADAKRGVELALDPAPDGWYLPRAAGLEASTALFSAAETFGFEGGSRVTVTLGFEAEAKQHAFARLRVRLTSARGTEHPAAHFVFDGTSANPKRDFVRRHYQDYEERLRETRRAYDEEKNRSVPVMVMEEMAEKRPTHVLLRGQYDARGDAVSPDVPRLLGGWKEAYPRNRVGLARWVTAPDNPLFARVTMNRYWQMLFGVGLVDTPEDFGIRGEAPSHPELLDALALDLMEGGWDLRAVLKKIVLSATYRQSSHERADVDDPENRLLARGPRFRLPAEAIRDQALFVSGQLVPKIGGPSVMVYQPEGLWLDLGDRRGFTRAHVVGDNDDVHRRSMYVYAKRAMPNPVLSTFDTPSRDVCVVERQSTNTPLQALVLRHELGYVESARVFAERLAASGGDFEARLERAWLMLLTRPPEEAEVATLRALWDERLGYFRARPEVREKLLGLGLQPRREPEAGADPVERDVELAAWTEVCRVLFNLSETLTRS